MKGSLPLFWSLAAPSKKSAQILYGRHDSERTALRAEGRGFNPVCPLQLLLMHGACSEFRFVILKILTTTELTASLSSLVSSLSLSLVSLSLSLLSLSLSLFVSLSLSRLSHSLSFVSLSLSLASLSPLLSLSLISLLSLSSLSSSLSKQPTKCLMRPPRVERGSQAWEACIMPLHYKRWL